MRRLKLKALVCALALAGAGAAFAQSGDAILAQLSVQITAVERSAARAGYARVSRSSIGVLPAGGVAAINLVLRSGGEYRIVGVCDRACGNLDLRLYDQGGGLITEDVGPGTVPNVSSIPRWTGQFRLQVRMSDCGARAGCAYALTVFAR